MDFRYFIISRTPNIAESGALRVQNRTGMETLFREGST